jgi:electron transfer flavoprotein alpha subunit
MSLLDKVFVVAENASVIDEVCAAGRTCGQKVEMVLIGSQEDAKRAISVGADKVYYLGEATVEKRVEDFLPTIAALIDQEKPAAIIFRTTVRGRLMAARLAAVLGTSVLTDASSLQVDGTALISKKRVYGGAALREEKAVGPVSVVCISPGIAAPLEADSSREGEIIEVAFIEPTRKVKCIETKAKVGEQVNLPAAKRVICVGRGMEAQDDLNMIYVGCRSWLYPAYCRRRALDVQRTLCGCIGSYAKTGIIYRCGDFRTDPAYGWYRPSRHHCRY